MLIFGGVYLVTISKSRQQMETYENKKIKAETTEVSE